MDRGEPQTVTPLSRHGDADPVTLPSPAEVEAEFDADGLVRQRPGRWELSTDMVMVGDYDDLAFLDPVELADGGCAVASGIGRNEPRPGAGRRGDAHEPTRELTRRPAAGQWGTAAVVTCGDGTPCACRGKV